MGADDGSLQGTPEEIKATIAQRHIFELDQYYENIKAHTFTTSFVALSLDDVKALRTHNIGKEVKEQTEAKLITDLTQKLDAEIKNCINVHYLPLLVPVDTQ